MQLQKQERLVAWWKAMVLYIDEWYKVEWSDVV